MWGALESAQAAWWQPVYDVGSWLAFLFAEWRWEETEETERSWMLWLVLPLLGILIWRMARRQRIRRGEKGNGAEAEQLVRQGADSAFFAIEQRLVAAVNALPGVRLGDTRVQVWDWSQLSS